ncbi:MAG: DUF190 domain-containing protein [Prolixibacteraceae bacterium]|jgi:hypothetical protein|nr:DUF190 domain-containing protein [Prolixibacteraceae bacterium]MDI9563520.1 DUF190 domain-containing protein [Bacteroidota bacterium]NLS99012.1 DUF190 domain-containing protein [Bacteroidales bacterium]OQB80858.1 MAG: hypothetical protein BWX87_01085 [Bacteroidetes bacterium ADurb.Bin123]HNU77088.1 DUF190 domain-containing protein [Prolixibacteraceae bacterium]
MNIKGKANILRIYIGESDTLNGHPLYEEILHAAHNAGLAGASAFKGILSFGASHSLHTLKTFAMSGDLPVLIEIADTRKNIKAFCPQLFKMMDESKKGGLVTIQKISVLRYRLEEKFNQFTSF